MRSFFSTVRVLVLICVAGLAFTSATSLAIAHPADYFRIDVVDDVTGRGVPLVELKTDNDVSYYTDSNGSVAVGDPELIGQRVYFHIKSHGYDYPKDGFGNRGIAFKITAGGREVVKIKRLNIAERLYRITGAGIYRDSVLVGAPTPLKDPLLNGLVMGQDTVHAIPYKGKIFWLWGDTNRPSYPLGNFFTSAATSLLPGKGGLDPSQGIDLTYWVDSEGFSKQMIPLGGSKPVWMGGLFTLPDDKGQERLFGAYSQVESDSKSLEDGLAVFDDEKAVFEKVKAFSGTNLRPTGGHTFKALANGQTYLYFTPYTRVRADSAHVLDTTTYEAYTCLVPGTRYEGANTQLERDQTGRLIYAWKANTATLDSDRENALITAKKLAPDEALSQFRDVETGDSTLQVGGSVYWNAYRNRWVRISGQKFGTSVLGEIWFFEADTPTGPWVYGRKIITHDNYTFYNSTQHPFFDQEDGRLIYLEGTYTSTYSGNKEHTPRYDYNQIMYRLALDDSRLTLPVPIYRLKDGSYTQRQLKSSVDFWAHVETLPFFAMPSSGDEKSNLVPVYATPKGLQLSASGGTSPLFYALPAQSQPNEKPNSMMTPLYEYTHTRTGERWYSTSASEAREGVIRAAQPLVRVWRNPGAVLPLDNAVPVTATP